MVKLFEPAEETNWSCLWHVPVSWLEFYPPDRMNSQSSSAGNCAAYCHWKYGSGPVG